METARIMRNLKIIIKILLIISFFSCSSLRNMKTDYQLGDNEGVVIFAFNMVSTMSIKSISFNIVGNNETYEVDFRFDDDNTFFLIMKKGVYQIESLKASATLSGGGSARDNTQYISPQRLYFQVIPKVVNYIGHVTMREAFSSTSANLIFRGQSSTAFLTVDISFNQRLWDIFKEKFPEPSKRYELKQNFMSFSKPDTENQISYTRNAGVIRGQTGVNFSMFGDRVKEILKAEKRIFDVVSINEIVERKDENSIIKYIFSDNLNDIRWRRRLFKIIEIVKMEKNDVIELLSKKFKKISDNKWENAFEIITIEKISNEINIIYTARNFLQR